MDESIELLERYGLVRDEDSLRVGEFDKTKISRLLRELHSAVFKKQVDDYASGDDSQEIDPFSFVAGRSLRGESDCGSYPCRLEKLDTLGRYTALYASRVILPLPLQDPSHVRNEAIAARQVSRAALALLRLRPLIEAGFVFPAVMQTPVCEHTKDWTEEVVETMHDIAQQAAVDFQSKCRIEFQPSSESSDGLATAFIHGPEDFIEHGELVLLFPEPPGWRLKSWRYDKEGKVELRGPRKIELIRRQFFDAIASDTSFYLTYGRKCNARYLASRKGETFLLDLFTRRRDEDLSASSAALSAFMTHSLPLMGDLPLAKLLAIRKEERDSFERYRSAVGRVLNDIAKKNRRIGKREIQEAFKEKIEPELTKMKSELYQERKRQTRRIVGGISSMAASLALGAFGGALPLAVSALGAAAAVGTGATLLTKAAQSTCEHGATLKEKNDFYFLLRLTQEAEAAG